MLTNAEITIYHKGYDKVKRLETWKRYNYEKCWCFENKSANINEGYSNANSVEIRIPTKENIIDIENIAIGDIIVRDRVEKEITTQQDLLEYQVYNITSIKNNNFGNTPHIHLGGR